MTEEAKRRITLVAYRDSGGIAKSQPNPNEAFFQRGWRAPSVPVAPSEPATSQQRGGLAAVPSPEPPRPLLLFKDRRHVMRNRPIPTGTRSRIALEGALVGVRRGAVCHFQGMRETRGLDLVSVEDLTGTAPSRGSG